jgi:hypothetical protein
MKQKLWIALITCLAYCIDRELWKVIEYLKEQVRVLKEQQEKAILETSFALSISVAC